MRARENWYASESISYLYIRKHIRFSIADRENSINNAIRFFASFLFCFVFSFLSPSSSAIFFRFKRIAIFFFFACSSALMRCRWYEQLFIKIKYWKKKQTKLMPSTWIWITYVLGWCSSSAAARPNFSDVSNEWIRRLVYWREAQEIHLLIVGLFPENVSILAKKQIY